MATDGEPAKKPDAAMLSMLIEAGRRQVRQILACSRAGCGDCTMRARGQLIYAAQFADDEGVRLALELLLERAETAAQARTAAN